MTFSADLMIITIHLGRGGEVVASNDLDSKFLIPKLFVFDQVIINIVAQSFLGGIGDCEKS